MSLKAFLFLILLAIIANHCIGIHRQEQPDFSSNVAAAAAAVPTDISHIPKSRVKRGFFWDFFQKFVTTKNLLGDQYVDTKNTLNEAYNLLNEGFSDPAPQKPTLSSTAKSTDADDDSDNSAEISTTTEKYVISRYELGRIIGRNFRGLQRLTKIEFQDALNQSHYNIAEYRAEARKQFANSLPVETKKKIESFKG